MEPEMWKWLKISLAVGIVLLLAVGFLLGYLYTDRGCMENPLIYGIEKMNEAGNDDDFICSCYSRKDSSLSFSFDKDEIVSGQFSLK